MVVKQYYTVLQVKWTRIPSHHCHSLSSIFSELVPSGTSGSLSVSISHEVCDGQTDGRTDGHDYSSQACDPPSPHCHTVCPEVPSAIVCVILLFFRIFKASEAILLPCTETHTHTHVRCSQSAWISLDECDNYSLSQTRKWVILTLLICIITCHMSSALCVFFSPRPDECDGAATDHTSVYSRAHRVRPESTKKKFIKHLINFLHLTL